MVVVIKHSPNAIQRDVCGKHKIELKLSQIINALIYTSVISGRSTETPDDDVWRCPEEIMSFAYWITTHALGQRFQDLKEFSEKIAQ